MTASTQPVESSATISPPRCKHDDRLIDVKAVSAQLGCNWRTVLRHADAGLMPAGLKIGALRRWRESEIRNWIDGGCKRVRSGKGV
jgi:predicted DNA-binding transcriptional regulator AlpA